MSHISPHLVTFHERIRLAGKLISEEELATTLAECERVNDGAPITYFEITTAAALLAFSRDMGCRCADPRSPRSAMAAATTRPM